MNYRASGQRLEQARRHLETLQGRRGGGQDESGGQGQRLRGFSQNPELDQAHEQLDLVNQQLFHIEEQLVEQQQITTAQEQVILEQERRLAWQERELQDYRDRCHARNVRMKNRVKRKRDGY